MPTAHVRAGLVVWMAAQLDGPVRARAGAGVGIGGPDNRGKLGERPPDAQIFVQLGATRECRPPARRRGGASPAADIGIGPGGLGGGVDDDRLREDDADRRHTQLTQQLREQHRDTAAKRHPHHQRALDTQSGQHRRSVMGNPGEGQWDPVGQSLGPPVARKIQRNRSAHRGDLRGKWAKHLCAETGRMEQQHGRTCAAPVVGGDAPPLPPHGHDIHSTGHWVTRRSTGSVGSRRCGSRTRMRCSCRRRPGPPGRTWCPPTRW